MAAFDLSSRVGTITYWELRPSRSGSESMGVHVTPFAARTRSAPVSVASCRVAGEKCGGCRPQMKP